MKIAVCQINTTIGDFKGNSEKIVAGIKWADENGADLAVFPEMSVTGYPPRDLLEKPHFILKNLECIEEIAKKCRKIGAIVGYVSVNELTTGRGLFNSAALLHQEKIRFIQHKALLPTYDVFDEGRYFEPSMSHETCEFGGEKIGITICEDAWSTVTYGGRKLYNYDPVRKLIKEGAKIIINISSSPYTLGKAKVRESLLTQTAMQYSVPMIYANLVGGNDELIFDGRSMVVNANGEIAQIGKIFEEDRFIVDTSSLEVGSWGKKVTEIEELERALVLGLKDYVNKCGFKKVVIGLSGGIDSAVVAALAVKGLGAKNVLGVAMPSKYSSDGSLADARTLANNLGIELKETSINDIHDSYLKGLSLKGFNTAEENVQARIRGNILMAISNETGAMVLSTGNKSEIAVGYCTLYGDMAGGLAVISDVSKTQVYQLAKQINFEKEVIPDAIIEKAPSAELKPDQKDTDSLPPYETLDQILKLYVEDHNSTQEIIDRGFEDGVVKDVVRRVDMNEYKRRQSPPGLKVTSKAFGTGRRCPIAWKS